MKKILFTLLIMLAAVTGFAQQESDSVAGASKDDPNVVVGAIGGTVDVSALGGAVYTIPIQVPEGIAGMQPNLSIVYNSQSDNGLLGWGWNLGGVSAITRVGTTLYHDGFIHGVNFSHDMNDRDALDRYALDGQRLMVVNGLPDGANGCEYRKEIDDMSKVVSYTCDTTFGPAQFKVWFTDGKTAYYGSKKHSRIGLNQRNDVCIWLLDSIVDGNGNYVAYRYEKDNSGYCLERILYTGNASCGIVPLYEVNFEYCSRRDKETSFIWENVFLQTKLLKGISVTNTADTKQTPLWHYEFDYLGANDINLYTHLNSVMFICEGKMLNSTSVVWGSTSKYEQLNFSYTGQGHLDETAVKFPGDFNGDGYTDIIASESYDYGENPQAILYLNRGRTQNEVKFDSIFRFELKRNISWIYVTDFDGDGLDDIMFANRERRPQLWLRDIVTFDIFLTRKNGDGSLCFEQKHTPSNDYRIASSKKETIILGDYTGEGKSGFIVQFESDKSKDVEEDGPSEMDSTELRTKTTYYVYYEDGMFKQKGFNQTLDADMLYPADYNGDGITEILYALPNGETRMVKLNVGESRYDEIVRTECPSQWDGCYPGDFNGDGKCDALFHFDRGDYQGQWHILLFDGHKFYWRNYFCWDIGLDSNPNFSIDCPVETREFVSVRDFNGDGKADIMYPNLYGRTIICYGPMRDNVGSSPYSCREQAFNTGVGSVPFFDNMDICFGRFLGKEGEQFLGMDKIRNVRPCSNNNVVSSITDGMGNSVTLLYDYLAPNLAGDHSDDFFTLDRDCEDLGKHIYSKPYLIKALSKVTFCNRDASTPIKTSEFRYKNVLVHTYGHGVLGFAATEKRSYVGNRLWGIVRSNYSTSVMGEKCLPVLEREFSYGPTGALVAETKYGYSACQSLRNGKQFMLLPTYQISWQNDIDHPDRFQKQILKKYTYESDAGSVGAYENVVRLKKQENGVSDYKLPAVLQQLCAMYTYQSCTGYEYDDVVNSTSYIIGRPQKVFSTTHRFGESEENNVYAQKEYEYGSSQHPMLPTKITGKHSQEDSNAPNEPHVADGYTTCDAYEYYPTGAVKTHTLSAPASPGLPTVTDTYAYSNNFYFLRNVTNAKGYVTSWEYNEDSYGNLRKETDANGLITKYDNDPLGVHSETIYPDQTRTVTEKLWVESNDQYAPERARYYVVTKRFDTNSASMGESRTYYDAACRELRSVSFGLEGIPVFTDKKYNGRGFVSEISDPYYKDTEANLIKRTSFEYDDFGRNTVTNFADGTSQSINYDGLTVSTTASPAEGSDLPVQTTSQTVNVMGWTMRSTDANGTHVNYAYYADGAMKYAQIGEDPNTRVSMEYDNARNRTKLVDPDYGTTTSVYNAYGQLVTTRNPRNVMTSMQYDELGRLVNRKESMRGEGNKITLWNYCDTGSEKGLLQSIDYDNGSHVAFYKYDNLKRVASITENIDGNSYTTSYGYHPATGRLFETTYPTGFAVRNLYTRWGHLAEITDVSDGRALWQTHEKNAYGQTVAFEMGKGTYFGRYDYYDDTHLLGKQSVKTSQEILQSMVYHYDDFRNLATRNDNVHGMKETFQYDRLNRLETITLNEQLTSTIKYDSYGRMEYKEADGRMVFNATGQNCYQAAKPHALREAVMNVNPFNAAQQDVTYTMFDKVKTIEQNGKRLAYTYDFDQQRVKAVETENGTVTREKIYVGNCEFITDPDGSHRLTFLSGPMGVFAVAEEINGNTELHYVMKDHLGSWTAIADAYGNIEQEFSYDAWGNSRDPYTWTGANTTHCMFDRGFTGHEMLYDFGLINMNGRCYDPVMSSFLSVDRYVQNPSNSQNFNRYSYCLNNPLKYVDPSGWYMNEPYMASYPAWSFGDNMSYEPRDLQYNSPYMFSCSLSGGGGVSYGGGGGSFAGTYGYTVANDPHYINNNFYIDRSPVLRPKTNFELIRDWHNNPCAQTRKALNDAGISDLNVFVSQGGMDGFRNSTYTWVDGDGKTYSYSVDGEYTGCNVKYGRYTLSNLGGLGSYMPPGYNYSGSGLCGSNPNPSQGMVMTLAMQEQISLHTTTTSSVAGIVDLAAKLANDGTLDGISRTASRTGRALGIIGLAPSLYNLINNRNFENAARFIIPGIAIGIGFVAAPWAAAASLGITLVDACGGFDWFYDCAGELDRNP